MDRPPTLDTRDRILRTALDLFAAHGYQRTSLREIADRLGLTKAGVLYHFPSKEHLLVALAEPLLSDLEAALDRAARLPWPAARWAALEGWLDSLLTHRRPLGTLYHDMTLLARGSTYARIMRLALQAYGLVGGANPTRVERIRAIQAIGMLGDPILFFADVPDDQLRAEVLDGAARLLGVPVPDPSPVLGPTPTAPPTDTDGVAVLTGAAAGGGIGAARAAGVPIGAGVPTATGPGGAGRLGEASQPAAAADPGGWTGERAGAGWARPARRRGAGRPRALTGEQIGMARAMHAAGTHTVDQIAASLGVSRATVYRQLRTAGPTADDSIETISDTI